MKKFLEVLGWVAFGLIVLAYIAAVVYGVHDSPPPGSEFLTK